MRLGSIERRLRKLEAAARVRHVLYVVVGRDETEAEAGARTRREWGNYSSRVIVFGIDEWTKAHRLATLEEQHLRTGGREELGSPRQAVGVQVSAASPGADLAGSGSRR